QERPGSSVPVLVSAGIPRYPAAAARAGIEDVVTVRVTVARGSVTGATAISGDRILAAAALEEIATWRFASDARAEFTSTFVFELHDAASGADRNLQLDLRLPSYAGISAARDGW
ncbi:MAG: TonB family protein, partial [Thermoanaerobaculia bacterium]